MELLPGIRYFQDFSGNISRSYDALPRDIVAPNALTDYRPFSLLLDTRLRVLQRVPIDHSGEGHVARLLDLARSLPDLGTQHPGEIQAPVLIVPRVFEPELCEELIEYYRTHENEDSGFMRDVGGKTVGVYDYGTKRRRDCQIEDEDLRKRCMHRIHDRLAPEIRRAYQFNATRMERYIIACYEGEHGALPSPSRQHNEGNRSPTLRRFGQSERRLRRRLRLVSRVRSAALSARLRRSRRLSCSLLHEATKVTSGTRYVFLPFLYDDEAARIRDQNTQFFGGNINAPPGVSA